MQLNSTLSAFGALVGGASLSTIGAGHGLAARAASSTPLPDNDSADAFLEAASAYLRLEAQRWAFQDDRGDFITDNWDRIANDQEPHLVVICDTRVAGRLDYRAARARCIVAVENDLADGRMSGDAARIVWAAMRDDLLADDSAGSSMGFRQAAPWIRIRPLSGPMA